jgi:acetyl/propionyl-CoA carboxylase alpha subunit
VRRGDSDGEAVVRGTLTPRLVLLAEVDGERVEALVRRSGPELWLALEGESHRFVQHDPAAAASGAETAASRLLAGLPGRVSEVNAVAGARVRRGAVLVRLEAMKMEHLIVAPRDAVVARVAVEAGAQVEEGDLLVELEDK